MKKAGRIRIVLGVLAALAAVVLFVTYGTALPSAPFAPLKIEGPSVTDSNGDMTVIVDSESRRALILNGDDDLTGIVGCATVDAPFEAITDACVSNGNVYLSGVRFEPDSDIIKQERVAVYDKGGNLKGIVVQIEGNESPSPTIKSLSDSSTGAIVCVQSPIDLTKQDNDEANEPAENIKLSFSVVDSGGTHELKEVDAGDVSVFDAACSAGDEAYYSTLSIRGTLFDSTADNASKNHPGHVFTSIDVGEDGALYACDDETGDLCVSPPGTTDVHSLVEGDGFRSVHVNHDVISLSNRTASEVLLCTTSGDVTRSLTEVTPSIGYSARMTIVWASGLYLAVLVIALAVRKIRQQVAAKNTKSIGPMFLSIAVVLAVAIAVGNLSFSSFQSSLRVRASEINTCADYLQNTSTGVSEAMEQANDRDALHGNAEELNGAVLSLLKASAPALWLVDSANSNGIGMYYVLYGKDDKGIFRLYDSSSEFVLGTSVKNAEVAGLDEAFSELKQEKSSMQHGHTLRDAAQYRLVQIPSSDDKSVVGVLEIGSKVRSFESSITSDLAKLVLAIIVMMLAVYLAYSEVRACGSCLFAFRDRRKKNPVGSVAVLTRPFTLAITMLTSIDSVMTVLIARELLEANGMGGSNALLALPAVMLGVGLIIGQGIYGLAGSRVGLRRLVARGATVMMLCACFTCFSVISGSFWLYCVAKLTMSIPFGMLYVLGYSLPRLATDDETRTLAAGGVKRTDTSAAALGTVLGGYAAQTFGNAWVYVLVALACIPLFTMAMNLLPRGMRPLEALAQPDRANGRIFDFVKTPVALGIALFVLLPATVAAGYASFLFPLFSVDLGLAKADINNMVVLGQLIVYVNISNIESMDKRQGKWKVTIGAVALLGVIFLLFAINTTLAWSAVVIALVALLGKASDGWKPIWLKAASDANVPTGRAAAAMFATRSIVLIAQPFIMGALLGMADSVAVIIIGAICLICAGLFFLVTRHAKSLRELF